MDAVEATVGFYLIPNHSRYVINRSGAVINRSNGQELSGSRNPAGYINIRLVDDAGHCKTWGRHRLLAFVFLKNDGNVDELYVNHDNGVKGDDRLENLEWVTPQQNVEHAGQAGLTAKCQPMSVRNVFTGEVRKFPSAIECARTLGFSRDAVAYRLSVGETRVFPEGLQYRNSWCEETWQVPLNIDRELLFNGTSKQVLMREVLTGEIFEFKKLTVLASYLGSSLSAISSWLKRKDQPVLPGLIQIKLATDPAAWRMVEDPYLELSQFTGKTPVVMTDRGGNRRIFESAVDCAREMGIRPTALHYRLKSDGQIEFSDGNRYCYYNTSLNQHSPTDQ